MLQPLSGKEVEYIADSMSNEDLLIKQCTASAQQCTNVQVKQALDHQAQIHTQHYQTLFSMMQQHQALAPTQPQ